MSGYQERGGDVKSALTIASVLASFDKEKKVPIDTDWRTDGQWSDRLHRRPNKFPYHRGKLQQQMWAAYGEIKKWIPSPDADPELFDKLSVRHKAYALLYYSSDLSDDEED